MTDEMKNVMKKVLSVAKLIGVGILVGIIISLATVNARAGREAEKNTQSVSEREDKNVKTISVEYLRKKLENTSKLMTAEMTYQGIYAVQSGKIPLLTKSGFSMSYEATVSSGIDTSLIIFDITDDKVIALLPTASIQGIHVDPDSIQFFDEKKAIFNWSKKIDVADAISEAENDVRSQADLDGINHEAALNAERVINDLLGDVIGERKLEVITR